MGVADDEFMNTLQPASLHVSTIALHGQRLLAFFYGRTAFGVWVYPSGSTEGSHDTLTWTQNTSHLLITSHGHAPISLLHYSNVESRYPGP
jgi:hypothetical protein